jgi:hypothetical protein
MGGGAIGPPSKQGKPTGWFGEEGRQTLWQTENAQLLFISSTAPQSIHYGLPRLLCERLIG